MRTKKAVVGLLSAFLVIGGSASAFAASEGTGNALDKLSATIKTFAAGTLQSDSVGKEPLNKKVGEQLEKVGEHLDNVSATIQTFDPGTLESGSEGKELFNKKVGDPDNLSVEMKKFEAGSTGADTTEKELFTKQVGSE